MGKNNCHSKDDSIKRRLNELKMARKEVKHTTKLSLILSTIGILNGIWLQYHLYIDFQKATGKTRALFGLQQLFQVEYSLFGIAALLLLFYSVYKKENLNVLLFGFLFSILAILLFILDIWTWI